MHGHTILKFGVHITRLTQCVWFTLTGKWDPEKRTMQIPECPYRLQDDIREEQKSREGPPTPQKVRTIHHYCPNTGTSIPLTDLTTKTLKTCNTIR
jgi:hypothetical protein